MRQRIGPGLVGCLMVASQLVWAEGEFGEARTFDPKVTYAVTYQVNETESNTLQPVEVLGVVSLGLRSFLLVQVKGFGEKKAYLDLESIRSIIQQ